ncbi:copper transport repressor, CopY/TcrY family [Alkalibacterium putridalgicola]|uniref:Copper transport repressor, CopY/TcrY family n=1 Tax=Alkalibacterium putridalgicola TaxID=426703 RepID=A0A1H7WZ44_9LACT|nr:CopY/TcrY family copper transport repressor [Alkalibacterium putridalgicola]GEK88698.1 uracil phosphoribosyltransferase [Alkalibacterium putridalgicola]SEM26554.1 copper transport repressor, CopY/TcrY family [Alkalibacterium putridalgicola]
MHENQISPSEWEIMRVVWTTHPITSKEINDILKEKKEWKLATTKTLIGRLVKKGLLSTEQKGRKYEYSPLVSEKESIDESIDDLLDQMCDTKVGRSVETILEKSVVSKSDLERLEALIEKKKADAPKEVKCTCTPGQCSCVH